MTAGDSCRDLESLRIGTRPGLRFTALSLPGRLFYLDGLGQVTGQNFRLDSNCFNKIGMIMRDRSELIISHSLIAFSFIVLLAVVVVMLWGNQLLAKVCYLGPMSRIMLTRSL